MIPNGMPGHPQGMQRPQGNSSLQNVFNKVLEELRSTLGQFTGMWQGMYDLRDRATKIMQL